VIEGEVLRVEDYMDTTSIIIKKKWHPLLPYKSMAKRKS
jgi:hypothetical protein